MKTFFQFIEHNSHLLVNLTLGAIVAVSLSWYLTLDQVFTNLEPNTDIVGYPAFFNFSIDLYYLRYFSYVFGVPLFVLACVLLLLVFAVAGRKPFFFFQYYSLQLTRIILSPIHLIRAFFAQIDKGLDTLYHKIITALALERGQKLYLYTLWLIALGLPSILLVFLKIHAVPINETEQLVFVEKSWIWAAFATYLVFTFYRLVTRGQDLGQMRRFVEQGVFLVVLPSIVFLFKFHTFIPYPVTIDMFHAGEGLAPAHALTQGSIPFKDLNSAHGLWHDALVPLFFLKFIDYSYIGYLLGLSLVVAIEAGFLVIFYYTVFGRTIAVIYLLDLFIFKWFEVNSWGRYWLTMLSLFSFYLYLKTQKKRYFVIAITMMVLAVALVSDLIFYLPAFLMAVFLMDIYEQRGLWGRYFHTLMTVGIGFGMGFIGWLLWPDSVEGILAFYSKMTAGHRFTAGVPFNLTGPYWYFVLFMPVLAILISMVQLIPRLLNHTMENNDWIHGILLVLMIPFYLKGISRADIHVLQPYYFAVLLFVAMMYRMFPLVFRYRSIYWVLLFYTVYQTQPAISGHLSNLKLDPLRYDQEHPTEWLGPSQIDPEQVNTVTYFQNFFGQILDPEDQVFDYANQPALFHFFLKLPPPVSYPYIAIINTPDLQDKIIRELEEVRPKYMIYSTKKYFSHWDVDNRVRHYKISTYLHQNYTPYYYLDTYQIFVRNDLKNQAPPVSTNRQEVMSADLRNSSVLHGIQQRFVQGNRLQFVANSQDPALILKLNRISDATEVNYVEITMRNTSGVQGQLFYSDDGIFTEAQSVIFNIHADKNWHTYRLPIEPIELGEAQVRFDPSNDIGEHAIESIRFFYQDLPGFPLQKHDLWETYPWGYIPYIWSKRVGPELLSNPNTQRLESKHEEEPQVYALGVPDHREVACLIVRMRLEPEPYEVQSLVYFANTPDTFLASKRVVFNAKPDGQFHDYVIRMSSLPNWYYADPIHWIKVVPFEGTHLSEQELAPVIDGVWMTTEASCGIH